MQTSSWWKTYTAAPHRVMFLGGVIQLALVLCWWGFSLLARNGFVTDLPPPIFSTFAHAWLMLFGLFPFFMFGFLMTTYPRWMIGPLVESRFYVGSFLLLLAGVVLFYGGLLGGGVPVLMAGVLVHLAGIGLGAFALYRVYRAVDSWRNRRYETHINLAWGFAILSEFAYLAWLATNEPLLLNASMRGALWLFLIPILVLVGHRMIPFFSSGVLSNYRIVQPQWSFAVIWLTTIAHFVLETFGAHRWLFVSDLPLLLLALHHSFHWQLRRSLSVPLLGSLHISFGFLSVGLALSVIQSAWLWQTGEFILGRAPLHAIGIGFVGGMVIAMVTRVSRGHSGRPLEMDTLDWYAFLAMCGAAVFRILSEVDAVAKVSPMPLQLIAAFVWLMAVIPWGMRYSLIYLRPRIDGKPG